MCNGFVLTPVPHRDLNTCYVLHNMQTYLIIITHLLPNASKGLKGVSGTSILLHAVAKKVKVCLYTAQYRVCQIAQSALHLPPGKPVHSPTRLLLLWEAF